MDLKYTTAAFNILLMSLLSCEAGVADMDAEGVGCKHEAGTLSPTSVPGGWAAMSDSDLSFAGSDGGAWFCVHS